MKKTLAAVAVLGAFAGSALAADVTLYGVVDTGFQYNHIDYDSATKKDVDNFGMKSGMGSGSRIGFKGTEDLGNGLTVGFILENQFASDTGDLTDDEDRFFAREASLFLQGGFGKIGFGRIGSINGGTSSWGKIGMISAFGTSWDNAVQLGTIMHTGSRMDNTIAYETPSFAGLKVYAQYSMAMNVEDGTEDDPKGDGRENESSEDRYYALGATYNNGPVAAYFAIDSTNYNSVAKAGGTPDVDDSLTVTLGGSYDFEVAKVYFGAQYFDEVKVKFLDADVKPGKAKGYALTLTADAPLAGGKAMFGVGYYDASEADSVAKGSEYDMTRWAASIGYDYPFSKRTDVYAVAGYVQDSLDYKAASKKDQDPSTYTVMFGLRHKF